MFTGLLQADEIAVAYGQRAMPKLVEVLSLPDLSDACSIECLQLLLSLLSSQVTPLSTAPGAHHHAYLKQVFDMPAASCEGILL